MILPKISIITVCRNVGENILDTILSVRSQTYSNIEYIVVDGASSDNTVDFIKRSSSLIDKWITEKDTGIYDAMNKGLRLATGDWINFMNVGDRFADKDVITRVFSENIPDNIKVIGGNTNNFFADGRIEVHYAEGGDAIRYRMPFSHQSCFVKRKLFDEESFTFDTNFKYAADYNLLNKVYYKYGASAIVTRNFSFANYKQEDSTSLVNYKKAKREYLRIQSSHINIRWIKEFIKYILNIY